MDALTKTIDTFDKFAREYEGKYMCYLPYVETYRKLADLLPANAAILDAACGPGNIAKFLLDDDSRRTVYGIDLSPKMVELARSNNPAGTFEVMDCRNILSLGRMFDAVVAGFCLPYLSEEEVEQFLIAASSILNPGGVLYLSAMEGAYDLSGLQTKNGIDWVCTYYHNAEALAKKLEAAGFQIIEIERKSFDREGEQPAIDFFVYARAPHAEQERNMSDK